MERTRNEDSFLKSLVEEAQSKGYEVIRESSVCVRILLGDAVNLKPGESLNVSEDAKEWSSRAVKEGYMVQSNTRFIRIGLSL